MSNIADSEVVERMDPRFLKHAAAGNDRINLEWNLGSTWKLPISNLLNGQKTVFTCVTLVKAFVFSVCKESFVKLC